MLHTSYSLFLYFLLIQRSPLCVDWVRSASIVIVVILSVLYRAIDYTEVKSAFHHVEGKFCFFFASQWRQRSEYPTLEFRCGLLVVFLCNLELQICLLVQYMLMMHIVQIGVFELFQLWLLLSQVSLYFILYCAEGYETVVLSIAF